VLAEELAVAGVVVLEVVLGPSFVSDAFGAKEEAVVVVSGVAAAAELVAVVVVLGPCPDLNRTTESPRDDWMLAT